MIWAEADEVFWVVVLFVCVNVVEVNDFVKAADDAFFCDFSVCFKVYVVGFSVKVGFVFFCLEDVVVATGAEAFGVDGHFSFATSARLNLGDVV